MVFIIDAHLPRIIVAQIEVLGHEAIHTSDLEMGNKTPDEMINELAVERMATVVTKDADFYNTFILHRKPPKLVMVKVGNMRLKDVSKLFETSLPKIIDALAGYDLIELHRDKIIGID